MAVLSCVEAFAYSEPNGVQRVLRPGDVVDDNDPAVKGREDKFEPIEVTSQKATDRREGKDTSDGVIAGGKPEPEPESDSDDTDTELEALRAAASAAGVKVDKRWGVDRLRDEIAEASG